MIIADLGETYSRPWFHGNTPVYTRFGNLTPDGRAVAYFLPAMTHFPQPHANQRSPRIQLNGSVGAAIHVEGGQRERAKLQTISITGGLLELHQALVTGDFVEIAFHTQEGAVHGMAEMLSPMQKFKSACLQPFRFIALGDDDHRRLRLALTAAQDRIFIDPATDRAKALSGF